MLHNDDAVRVMNCDDVILASVHHLVGKKKVREKVREKEGQSRRMYKSIIEQHLTKSQRC